MARKTVRGNGQRRTDIELSMSNFGPIAKGKIALRPLTVLVGQYNSGKSCASVLAHSVISSCADLAAAARSGDWTDELVRSGKLLGLIARVDRLYASSSGRGEVAVPRDLSDDMHRRNGVIG